MNFNFKRYFLLFLILSLLFFSLNSVNAISDDDNEFSDSLDGTNMESIEKITDKGDNSISVDEQFSKECSKGGMI